MKTAQLLEAARSPAEGLAAFRAAMSAAWRRGAAPLPDIKPSEWAEGRIVLPPPVSRPYHAAEAPYQPGILDSVREPGIHTVVAMMSAQVGKTIMEAILCAYFMKHRPSPILGVLPSIEDARDYKDEQLGPLLEETPELADLVLPPAGARSKNTKTRIRFRGGYLALVGSNSHSGMARRTVRFVLADEVDKWKIITGAGGDQLTRLRMRFGNVRDGVMVVTSTPLETGMSVVETEFLRSDQRRFFVPCPSCNAMQTLRWRDRGPDGKLGARRLVWERDGDGRAVPGSERYLCEKCDHEIEERWKQAMLQAGDWRATAVGLPGIAGFALNQLYSPWRHWIALREQWDAAQDSPGRLRVFINEVLGETFDEDPTPSVELGGRREVYGCEVPAGVGCLTAAVDTQDNWLECIVKGWGAGQESWLIAHVQFLGDPNTTAPWLELVKFLRRPFIHATGAKLYVMATTVDTQGHKTDAVYTFCRGQLAAGRRVLPIRGASASQKAAGRQKEFIGLPSRNNAYRVPLYTLNVDVGKDMVFGRMKLQAPGPGYMHIPDWAEDEYLDQLAKSEKAIRKYVNGRPFKVYVPLGPRTEGLDLEVYNLAALHMLGKDFIDKLGETAAAIRADTVIDPAPRPAGRRMRSSGAA
jgi:phage terminase large subunit GpA-like protein